MATFVFLLVMLLQHGQTGFWVPRQGNNCWRWGWAVALTQFLGLKKLLVCWRIAVCLHLVLIHHLFSFVLIKKGLEEKQMCYVTQLLGQMHHCIQ